MIISVHSYISIYTKRNVFLMVIFKRLKVFVLNNLLLQIRFVVLESLIRFGILEMITLSKEECLRDMQFLWILMAIRLTLAQCQEATKHQN